MKALSIKQPWASLVAAGAKPVECRTWKTNFRGPLLICSSKGNFDWDDEDATITLPGGMALAVVDLVDVRPMTEADLDAAYLPDDWQKDALKGFAWHVRPLYAVKPTPIKGKLNLFNVDEPLEKIPDTFLDHWEYLRFQQGLSHYTR